MLMVFDQGLASNAPHRLIESYCDQCRAEIGFIDTLWQVQAPENRSARLCSPQCVIAFVGKSA